MPLHIADCTGYLTHWKFWRDIRSNRDGNSPILRPEPVAVSGLVSWGGECSINPLPPSIEYLFINKINDLIKSIGQSATSDGERECMAISRIRPAGAPAARVGERQPGPAIYVTHFRLRLSWRRLSIGCCNIARKCWDWIKLLNSGSGAAPTGMRESPAQIDKSVQ